MSFDRLSQNALLEATFGGKSIAMPVHACGREMPSRVGGSAVNGDHPAAARMAVSLDYMLANLGQPLKISTLSDLTGYSASRFFELFKSVTGDTPLNWFIRARMVWAGALLKSSNLQIKEIADRVGYGDPFYFSRVFKSVHGIAPSAYRSQEQDNSGIVDDGRKPPASQTSWSQPLDLNGGRTRLPQATDLR